ncbi:hypothetical protein [Falsirhodobacter sp. alg1]|uniref:hypothetical protein n=1 Tax=Falsirhodobacter sp. alg1 TaxID=1472418 RepID=UPI0005EE5473|nr:hypothetical protein [Falsirhodobacter sp. alg1]
MSDKTSIIFVVDPPGLVVDGLLLLSSLRKHMPDIDIVPYCPAEKKELLPPQVVEFFNHYNAPIQFMETKGQFSPAYKQGNKLLAAATPRDTDATIFLDTDIIITQPFRPDEVIASGCLSAAPEGRYTWGKAPDMWPSAYATFGMEVPEERINLAKSNALSPPYFNAGVVAYENRTPSGEDFSELWLRTAKEIDNNPAVIGRRPWLDQISLPIAMARAGLKTNLLEKKWNLSLTHSATKPTLPDYKNRQYQTIIDGLNAADPVIAHYHNHGALNSLRYGAIAKDLIAEFTCYDSVQTLREDMVGKSITKGEVMAEFHKLKAIKERTPEEQKRFSVVNTMKREFQAKKRGHNLYANWPDSLLPN